MDSRFEVLERSVETLQKVVEDRDERMNQQMEELRSMLTSFMSRRTDDQDEAQFERSGAGGSRIPATPQDAKSVHEVELPEFEEEKKYWFKRKVELPNFDGRDQQGG